MSNHQAIHDAIRSRYGTLIEDAESLPSIYDNQDEDNVDDALWARVWILDGDSKQKTLGSPTRRYRTVGILTVILKDVIGKGDRDILIMADKVKDAFISVTDTGVVYQTPSVKVIGRQENWWQVNVECPWYSDVIQ